MKAYLVKPTRAEPLFYLARFYRKNGDYFSGFLAARQGLLLPFPEDDLLFVFRHIYDYELLKEYALCCCCLEKNQEALLGFYLMLGKDLPPETRVCTLQSIALLEQNLRKNF